MRFHAIDKNHLHWVAAIIRRWCLRIVFDMGITEFGSGQQLKPRVPLPFSTSYGFGEAVCGAEDGGSERGGAFEAVGEMRGVTIAQGQGDLFGWRQVRREGRTHKV